MSSVLQEILKWVLRVIVIAIAALFFAVLAHAGASAEARSDRGLVWKLMNLLYLPFLILLFSALLNADIRRVYYPPRNASVDFIVPSFSNNNYRLAG